MANPAAGAFFGTCIANNQTSKASSEKGLRDIQYMAQIYRAASHQSGRPSFQTQQATFH
jgi:hypothetical protein